MTCSTGLIGSGRRRRITTSRWSFSPATASTIRTTTITSAHTTWIPSRLLRTGVAFSDIKKTVSAIAGKALFFVDSCHSGNAIGLGARRGPLDINIVINELSSAENGVVVFSASTSSESSYEREEWGNGAFTKALVEGLNGAASIGSTGRITYNMLNVYISERVKELTKGQQHPTMISPQTVPDFPIAVKH